MGDSDNLSMNILDGVDDNELKRKVVRCYVPGADAGRKLPCDDNLGTAVGVGPMYSLIGPQARSRLRGAVSFAGLGLRDTQLANNDSVLRILFDYF